MKTLFHYNHAVDLWIAELFLRDGSISLDLLGFDGLDFLAFSLATSEFKKDKLSNLKVGTLRRVVDLSGVRRYTLCAYSGKDEICADIMFARSDPGAAWQVGNITVTKGRRLCSSRSFHFPKTREVIWEQA